MKRTVLTAAYTVGLLALVFLALLCIRRLAESSWLDPAAQNAPVIRDTAAEQVESELKAYPYQILTLSAAEILYKELSSNPEVLTARPHGEGCITAAEAAAIAGGLAETLYSSDLSEKTLDLLPAVYHAAESDIPLWLAAYTLPDAPQTAPDGNAYTATQGCWAFVLNAADGSLLFSRCTALEGTADENTLLTSYALDDSTMLTLYERSLSLAETLGLCPVSFWAGRTTLYERGFVQAVLMQLDDGRLCRLIFDEYYATGALYSVAIAEEAFFSDTPPDPLSRIALPLALPEEHDLPAAPTLAAESSTAGDAQSASYSAASDTCAWVSGYHDFSARNFFLYRIDPVTATRSLLCEKNGCRHRIEDLCPARTGLLTALCAGDAEDIRVLDGISLSAVVSRGDLWQTRREGDGYVLTCQPAGAAVTETVTSLPAPMHLFGSIGDHLLLSCTHAGLTVIETERGLQPHDAGWRQSLFAYDTSAGELIRIYAGEEAIPILPDVKNGRLWEMRADDAGLRLCCRDLFTGESAADIPTVLLEGLAVDSRPTRWELAGRFMVLRFYEKGTPHLFLVDTVSGAVRELLWSDAYNVLEIIACFGDEILVQQNTGSEHRYYLTDLAARFEGTITRRWVQDDFVIG